MDAELRQLLRDLIDEGECLLDHDGDCQAHDWFGGTECPHARGKRLLRDVA